MSASLARTRVPENIRVHGAKGGVGATTVALSLAVRLGVTGRTVSLSGVNTEGIRALVSRRVDDQLRDLAPGVNLPDEWEPDVAVYDAGTTRYFGPLVGTVANVLVVRNDYASLRAATLDTDTSYDAGVLFVDPTRALSREEAGRILPLPTVAVDLDPVVARRQDAGLYLRSLLDSTATSTEWIDLLVGLLARRATDA